MNEESWEAALQTLRDEQMRLKAELQRIDTRIGQLAILRAAIEPAAASLRPAAPTLHEPAIVTIAPGAPPAVPPPLPVPVASLKLAPAVQPSAPVIPVAGPVVPPLQPPPLPAPTPRPFIESAPVPANSFDEMPGMTAATPSPVPPPLATVPTPNLSRRSDVPLEATKAPLSALPTATNPAKPAAPTESLEMRVGSYWLVRIGVAVLLTGLVFLATYLYQTYTPQLGPAGKIALLYVASFGLLGAGTWLGRKSKEPRMQNFASVVEAGGLAAVFFTTYAAHYFPGLRIISQPAVAGALLLAWTAFIVWLSSRRASPTLATGAILLMGYTTAVHPVGTFALVANLVVVLAALYLFWRHKWSLVSFAALASCYGGYFYWRFFEQTTWSERGEFWVQLTFLAMYWLLFGIAGFIGSEAEVRPRNRAFLVGLNNSAFFSVATLLIVENHRSSFWQFAAVYGVVLLVLGALCHRRVDAATAGVYRMQGLLLITTAIITYFSGWQLGLMLAIQTAVLASAASWRCSRVLLLAAMLAGLIATVTTIVFAVAETSGSIVLQVTATGSFLLLAAWIAQHRPRGETPELYPGWFSFAATLFTIAGPAVWFVALCVGVKTPALPVALAVVAAGLTLSSGLLRLPLFPGLGLLWFAASIFQWLMRHGALRLEDAFLQRAPGWSTATLIVAALILGRWWRSDSVIAFSEPGSTARNAARALVAIGGMFILTAGVWPWCTVEHWLIVAPLLATGVMLAAWTLRDKILGFAGQLPLIAGCLALFLSRQATPVPRPGFALFAALAPMFLVILGSRLSAKLEPETRTQVTGLGVLYQILSAVLTVFWIFDYLPPTSQPLALAIAAVVIYLGNLLGAGLLRFLFASLGAVALVTFLLSLRNLQPAGFQSLIAILLLALPFEWARRKGLDNNIPDEPIRSLCLAAIALSGWGWISSGYWHSSGFALVTAWTLYATALLALGVAIRERVYQFAGFGVLIASLVHVALFDLWAHETPALLPAALALAAVALTFSVPHVKLPMFPALGPIWFIAAVVAWLVRHGGLRLRDAVLHQSPWWSAVIVIASALIIGRYWQRAVVEKLDHLPARDALTSRLIAAVGGVLILCASVRPLCSVELWQLMAPLLAIGVVAAALLLRDGVLASTAQLPILAGCAVYALERSLGLFPSTLFALFPALSPMLVALGGPRLATKFSADETVPSAQIGILYEIASVLLSVLWIFDYLPRAWQPFALAVVGVAYFALNRAGLGVHGIFFLILGVGAVMTFWVATWNGERGGIQNLLTILLLGLPFEWARRTKDDRDLPDGLNRSICLAAIAVTGWRWVSTGNWQDSGFYLAAAWAVYAAVLLGVGLAVRERVYRLAGFGILAATLIRVTIFDAWRLGVAYRMISFIVLGAVLMIVGFLYNRYQDKLKEWL